VEIFPLNRDLEKIGTYESFKSMIWTERYYGDGDFELFVPDTSVNSQAFKTDSWITVNDSEEVMVVENCESNEGILSVKGISLLKWLNNRFVRTSADPTVTQWVTATLFPGEALQTILTNMVIGGPYLDGTNDIGIPVSVLNNFKIPRLSVIGYDTSGTAIVFSVPFGPLYDTLKTLATTYQIGMKIVRHSDVLGYFHGFISYKGEDRTSDQSVNPVVQFSPEMESLTNVKELRSSEQHKNLVYTFLSSAIGALPTTPGHAGNTSASGFDLRVAQITAENINEDQVGGDATTLLNVLNQQSESYLDDNKYVALIDGQIVPTGQLVYGTHYSLGDIVEFAGSDGVVSHARITEYIRTKDETGESAYPTVEVID
jgi:hypothetical protein